MQIRVGRFDSGPRLQNMSLIFKTPLRVSGVFFAVVAKAMPFLGRAGRRCGMREAKLERPQLQKVQISAKSANNSQVFNSSKFLI